MQIYVADLAAYNAGHLHGTWIECDSDVEVMQEQVNEMLVKSPVGEDAEEYAIHDTENCTFGQYTPLSEVAKYVELIEEVEKELLGTDAQEVVQAFEEAFGDPDTAENIVNAYYGQADSEKDFAYDLMESSGDLATIPEHLQFYFDYDAFARDLFINDFVMSNGYVFFRNW